MATAGGHCYLLLSTALSLAVIAIAAALTSADVVGSRTWGARRELKKIQNNQSGGLLRVLRQALVAIKSALLMENLIATARRNRWGPLCFPRDDVYIYIPCQASDTQWFF